MQYLNHRVSKSGKTGGAICLMSGLLLLLSVSGCGTNAKSSPAVTTPQKSPQAYLAPYVAGSTNDGGNLSGPQTYTIDDVRDVFSQTTYVLDENQEGAQVINSGMFTASSRGLLNLGLTANYFPFSGKWTTYSPPATGGFAVELAGQAGGLMQLAGQPAVPLVAATQCPNLSTPQPYQFITIPDALITGVDMANTWNPAVDTAYGSVDIGSSGSTVKFANIKQFTLPSVGGSGAPAQPAPSSVTGVCGPSSYGNTISIPGQIVVTDPGGAGQTAPPQAIVGIGPTGLLVEDNGATGAPVTGLGIYQNALGAGTGAVGLPKPGSPLDPVALTGAQYLGFIYGAGFTTGAPGNSPVWSSNAVSFVPSSCSAIAPSSGATIYGVDFTSDPSTPTSGSGNCDVAIDLGTQDPSNNGLYPNATVWFFSTYAANTMKKTYSFHAVAIAGQLQEKLAIFVIGVDSSQPWEIYLMQSTN